MLTSNLSDQVLVRVAVEAAQAIIDVLQGRRPANPEGLEAT
ncbi:MAG: hypothetical protein VX733_11840 [Candidatus Latescibacterota bacterium]|nr:hypothetical protein [Candidatus Latescibacterota bacterium]